MKQKPPVAWVVYHEKLCKILLLHGGIPMIFGTVVPQSRTSSVNMFFSYRITPPYIYRGWGGTFKLGLS